MNENSVMTLDNLQAEAMSLDELEANLSNELEEQLSGLEFLEKEREKIGNPEGLGATIGNAIWEQFILQIGSVAGEDFIKENRGMTLNLKDSAHIQTTKNFAKGKIATHNDTIDYQKRYDDWQSNFERDKDGNIKMHSTRSGRMEANLVRGARDSFDKSRPRGNVEKGTDMDHTVSAGEVIRDAHANAHLSKEEQIAFANSDKNLNEIRAELNRSKKDTPMTEWLDNPNSKGQKPAERFNISKEEEKGLRAKDKEARKEYNSVRRKGEERSIKTGRRSQLREAGRIGAKALRALVLGLLADFLKVVIKKLVSWFRSAERKFSTFIDQFKEAFKEFWANIKTYLWNGAKTIGSTIITAIFKPIEKICTILKMGWSSLSNAISYLCNPENKTKPFSIVILELGKIVIAGLSGAGALVLGEIIEKGLISAGLVVPIPLLGSLASIIGMFLGSIVFGIIGAVVIRWIDKLIANKLKKENTKQQIEKQNEILATQEKLISVVEAKVENTKETVAKSIIERHDKAKEIVEGIADDIRETNNTINKTNIIIDKTNVTINRANHTMKDTENIVKNVSTVMNNKDNEINIKSKNVDVLNDLFDDLNKL